MQICRSAWDNLMNGSWHGHSLINIIDFSVWFLMLGNSNSMQQCRCPIVELK